MGVSARRGWLSLVVLAVGLGLAVRIWAALQWQINFDSDEAVFALMARHLLAGSFTPVVYGTDHLGSIESVLSSLPMLVMGQSVPAFRSSTLFLMLLVLSLQAIYVIRHWGARAAFFSTLFLAVPGFHILEWTYQPIGAYCAMLALGMGIVLLSERLPQAGWGRYVALFFIGILVGLGLWSNQMILAFIAAVAFVKLLRSEEWKRASLAAKARLDDRQLTSWLSLVLWGGFLGVVVLAFFSSYCSPVAIFSRLQFLARLILAAGVGVLALGLMHISETRVRRAIEAASLLGGAVVGFSPEWLAWASGQLTPVSVIRRSCPTGIVARAHLLLDQILPALWGIPTFSEIQALAWWKNILWLLVTLLVVGSILFFVWSHRHELWNGFKLTPILESETPPVMVMVLVATPLFLSLVGSNTVDIYSVRHLLVTWLGSAALFGIAIDLAWGRSQWLVLTASLFWIFLVALSSLWTADGRWRIKFTPYPPSEISALVAELQDRGVTTGYADYWGAYTLDFLTQEELVVAPYNGLDRYHAYTRQVGREQTNAFIFPKGRSPAADGGMTGLADLLSQPNDVSGEGPARASIIKSLGAQHLQTVFDVGEWQVWVVER